jgi:TPP-dependent indolepyruvate ferredoxin oxidoreductase alpha subunit
MNRAIYRTIILFSLLLLVLISGISINLRLQKELDYQQKRAKEFRKLITEYRVLKEEVSRFERGNEKVNIINEVNSIIEKTGLRERLRSIKPSQKKETVIGVIEEMELNMERLTMNEIANLLYQINQRPFITISKLSLKSSFSSPSLLNATFLLSTLSEKRTVTSPPNR